MRIGCVVKIVRRVLNGYYWSRFQQAERLAIDLGFKVARLESDLIEAKVRLARRREGGEEKKKNAPTIVNKQMLKKCLKSSSTQIISKSLFSAVLNSVNKSVMLPLLCDSSI